MNSCTLDTAGPPLGKLRGALFQASVCPKVAETSGRRQKERPPGEERPLRVWKLCALCAAWILLRRYCRDSRQGPGPALALCQSPKMVGPAVRSALFRSLLAMTSSIGSSQRQASGGGVVDRCDHRMVIQSRGCHLTYQNEPGAADACRIRATLLPSTRAGHRALAALAEGGSHAAPVHTLTILTLSVTDRDYLMQPLHDKLYVYRRRRWVKPGDVLAGRYKLEARLSRGGMGEIWQGIDHTLQRHVAVKVVRPDIPAEPGPAGSAPA